MRINRIVLMVCKRSTNGTLNVEYEMYGRASTGRKQANAHRVSIGMPLLVQWTQNMESLDFRWVKSFFLKDFCVCWLAYWLSKQAIMCVRFRRLVFMKSSVVVVLRQAIHLKKSIWRLDIYRLLISNRTHGYIMSAHFH